VERVDERGRKGKGTNREEEREWRSEMEYVTMYQRFTITIICVSLGGKMEPWGMIRQSKQALSSN
jgi:hypothetical protein